MGVRQVHVHDENIIKERQGKAVKLMPDVEIISMLICQMMEEVRDDTLVR